MSPVYRKLTTVAISLIIFIAALELGIRVLNVTYFSGGQPRAAGDELVILTLGESTTADRIGRPMQSWPQQLQKILDENHIKAKIINEGVVATSTNSIVNRTPELIRQYHPGLIITMMGVNDAPRFWNKAFILTSQDNLLTHLKTYKLLMYFYTSVIKSRSPVAVKNSDLVPPPEFALGFEEPAKKLVKYSYNSAEFKKTISEIDNFLKDKSAEEKAKYYSWLFYRTQPDYNFEKKNYQIPGYLAERALDGDAGLYVSPLDLIHAAMLSDRAELCPVVTRKIKAQNLKVSEPFLRVLSDCPLEYHKELNEFLKWAGDIYEFRSSDEGPTAANYRQMSDLLKDAGIPWVIMNYPNREFPSYMLEAGAGPAGKVHLLSNKETFQKKLQSTPYDELFEDSFAGNFGHTTIEGSKLIAENVYYNFLKDQIARACSGANESGNLIKGCYK